MVADICFGKITLNIKSEEIRFLNSLLTNKFSQKIGNGFRRKVQKQMNLQLIT